VAIEDSDIETRSSARFVARVFNSDHRVEVENVNRRVSYENMVKITGTAPGAEKVEIVRGYRILGVAPVTNSRWHIAVPGARFGMGPASFFVRALYEDGSSARSDFVGLSVGTPPSLSPAMGENPPGTGLNIVAYDMEGNEHALVVDRLDGPVKELRELGLKARRLILNGYFHVDKPGFYQLGLGSGGRLSVSVNGQVLLHQRTSIDEGEAFLPLSLERGWYKLEIDLVISGRPYLKAVLAGDQAPLALAGDRLGRYQPRSGQ
jgi:hypothetical protein